MTGLNPDDLVDLMRAVQVGLWQVDLRRGEVWWSERTRAIHEVGPDFVPTLESAIAFYAPEGRPLIEDAVRRGMEAGEAWDLELPFVTARGRRLWVRARGRAVLAPDGPVRLIGTFEDVTEQRRQSDELKRLAMVVQQMTNAAIITDAAGLTQWVNPAFESLTGYSLADLLGRPPGALLQGPETDPATVAAMREAIRAGRGFHVEVVNYTAAGRPYWIEIRSTPIRDADGTLRGFIAIEDAIDARRRAEAAARAELSRREAMETLLRDILEALPSAVTAFDRDERLLLHNAAYLQFYPAMRDVIRPGVQLEELVRIGVARGIYATEIAPDAPPAAREAWISRYLAAHRATGASRELRLPDGRWLQMRERRSPSGNLVCVRTDITTLKTMEEDARRRADEDALTGLANRAVLIRRLAELCAERRRRDRPGACLVLFDVDHFKAINDGLGHHAGDAVLRTVAERLRGIVRDGDTVARLGGDEFALLLPGLSARPQIERFLRRMTAALKLPLRVESRQLQPSFSLGVATFPADARRAEDLLRCADAALYQAKRQGRDRWAFFEPALAADLARRAQVAARLPAAIAEGRITVALQPKLRLADGSHAGFEALARWQEGQETILPGAFVPIAEESGLAVPLGNAVLAALGRAVRGLVAAGLDPGRIAVNVSTQQLLQPNAAEQILGWLEAHGLSPRQIEIEVTETVLLDRSVDRIAEVLAMLREAGATIALDDFGTGYASLAHLTRFPVTSIKIDRRFVAALGAGGADALIAQTVIGLARGLGVETVAEGVEEEAQRLMLRELGCDVIQGYLIARPLTPEDAALYLAGLSRPDPDGAARPGRRRTPPLIAAALHHQPGAQISPGTS
jgi:diguanylate cyclase (GGDEF)-like protein/PAS domain S-box-containing protein